MIQIAAFTFNPFEENTYLLYDDTKGCAIIDPGCHSLEEKKSLVQFIEKEELRPVKLLLTHSHIDHILGNNFVCGKYNLKPEVNHLELPMLQNAKMIGQMYGIEVEPSPDPEVFLTEGDVVQFGNCEL